MFGFFWLIVFIGDEFFVSYLATMLALLNLSSTILRKSLNWFFVWFEGFGFYFMAEFMSLFKF